MNNIISIRSMKVGLVVVALLSVFAYVFVGQAAVTGITATLNGDSTATVATGSTVDVAVSVTKSSNGCENNWRSTVVKIDGNEIVEETIGSITGTGVVNDSFSFTAPTEPGEYSVLVEVMGGGESFGETVCDDEQVWGSVELSLTVYEPVAPFINVENLAPLGVERVFGDTNPLVYTAEVAIGGNPTVPHVQCLIFDVFKGDGWNLVPVSFESADTYDAEDGVTFSYDISGYATGTYQMVVIALDSACDNLPEGFDSADYIHSEDTNAMRTVFTIVDEEVVEPVPVCDDYHAVNYEEDGDCLYRIFGYLYDDTDEDDNFDEGEAPIEGWVVKATNTESEEEVVVTDESDASGLYELFVTAGTWRISQETEAGWEQLTVADVDGDYIVTVPVEYEEMGAVEAKSFLATAWNWLVPTAHAVYYEGPSEGYGAYNFGNNQIEEEEETRRSSSSSGTKVGARNTSGSPTPQVLGAATSAGKCGVLISEYLRLGQEANTWEVMKLQLFLTGQGFFTPVTGIFDTVTDTNVRLFQAKYSTDILAPWGITEATGYVYKTTLWKLNNMVCPGSQAMPIL